MTAGYILLQNLKRNRVRTGLTLLAFALPMGIFVGNISLIVAFRELGIAFDRQQRLATHNKATLINGLPEGYRRQIETLDPKGNEISAVCGMRWFGGKIPNEQQPVMSLGADADTFPTVYADTEMTKEDIDAWNRDRQAAVVGFGVCELYKDRYKGWEPGGRVVLKSTVPPYLELEFHIIKVLRTPGLANVFYFRRDYLTESLKAAKVAAPEYCNIFWIKCRDAGARERVQRAVDGCFANSTDLTKTEDENTFGASFAKAAGDIPGLMAVMSVVVVIIVALVAGNSMMMSLRERTREFAVFKAIGFSNARVFRVVLSESVLLSFLGAILGIIPTTLLLIWFPIRKLNFGPINALHVSPYAVIISLIIALLVGVVAGAWPAVQALRIRTVDALRRVA